MFNKMQHKYLDFIIRSLYMFQVLSVPIIRSTVTVVDSHWHKVCYISERCARVRLKCPNWVDSHITLVLTRPWCCDYPPDLDIFKWTLPQCSLPNVTYVVPVAVSYSYCTPDNGYRKYPKHVEWSCNKIKLLVLHLVRYFMCILIENDAWNHEHKFY
jgi:hypothetical protein